MKKKLEDTTSENEEEKTTVQTLKEYIDTLKQINEDLIENKCENDK